MAKYDSLRLKEKKNNKIATIKIMVCGIAIAFTEEVCGKFQRNPQFFINQRLLLVDALGPGVALGVRWGTRDVAAVCGVQDFLAVTCSESSERHWKGLGYAPPPSLLRQVHAPPQAALQSWDVAVSPGSPRRHGAQFWLPRQEGTQVTEQLPSSVCCVGFFVYIKSFSPSPVRRVLLFPPRLQMRKPRPRKLGFSPSPHSSLEDSLDQLRSPCF